MTTKAVAVEPLPRVVARPQVGRVQVFWQALAKDLRRNRWIYLMLLPVVGYYLLFSYGPMWGAQIAFRQFRPGLGIWGSPWIGLQHFRDFFTGFFFERLVRNTFMINLLELALAFPAPIILALLLNELTSMRFKRFVQTVSYMPHFISIVVVAGMMVDFLARDGLINNLLAYVGVGATPFLQRPEWFQIIFVGSIIWQGVGWGSIIYLAALTQIDPTLYEAAMVDGAGRFRRLIHITLPGIAPTIIILLILRLGGMMSVGFERVLLLYNPLTYETADVIQTYVFRKGILEMDFAFSAAVGLFNSVINFSLLVGANAISRRVNETSLW